jgi:hypothetical protein
MGRNCGRVGFVDLRLITRPEKRSRLPPLHELAISLDDQRQEKLDPHSLSVPGHSHGAL